jgi:WD40 repeat protein
MSIITMLTFVVCVCGVVWCGVWCVVCRSTNFSYNPSVQTNLDIELAYNLDHDSVVCCVKFSHDGKYLATGSNKKTQIYDVATGEKALYVGITLCIIILLG